MMRFSGASAKADRAGRGAAGSAHEAVPLPVGWPAFILLVLSMVINLLALTGPLYMLQVYDRVLSSRSVPTLVVLSVLVIVLYGFVAVLDAVRARIGVRVANLIDQRWSERVFSCVVRRTPTPVHNVPDPVRDLDTVRQVVAAGGPTALLDLPWLPIYILAVFLLHPVLGWLATLGALGLALLLGITEVSIRGLNKASALALARRQRLNEDARKNADAILAMGMLRDIGRVWRARGREVAEVHRRTTDRASLFAAISRSFRFFLQSAVLGVGAFLVIRGEMTGGMMIGASMITARALAPIDRVVGQYRGLISAQSAIARLRTLFAAMPEAVRDIELPLPHRSLTVSNLATGPSGDKVLVSGVSCDLQAGDGLGIIGLSGSGKSSLVRALAGVWPLLLGEVRFDGASARHFDPERLGKTMGYLPQTVDLFAGTIAQNIARFDPSATSEAVIDAALAAGCHDMILSFRDGYDTEVGEFGSQLSAGQRQRIGLARALYGQPFLIILDEPNANLDAAGEEALTACLEEARGRGAIVVVVAHRPAAIAALNKVLYLQQGRQAAFGAKDDILAQVTQVASGRRQIEKAEADA